jgi:uncharacterized repeat protein (TIGR03803 family)
MPISEIRSFLMAKSKSAVVLAVLLATCWLPVSAQVFTKLVDFGQDDDPEPYEMQLLQDRHGNLWGTSAAYYGTVFSMTTSGQLTTIYGFGIYGIAAYGGVLGTDGNYYGITQTGGANALGNIYKVTPEGDYTDLHDFDFATGQYPMGPLLQAPDGYFYGATLSGGSSTNCQQFGCGVLYKLNPAGDYIVLHNFEGIDGEAPFGGLILASDGKFYGTTTSGIGKASYGVVFSITTAGEIVVLHKFTEYGGGATPWANVVEGADGNFYGTTAAGGINQAGMVYRITPQGQFTKLHFFRALVDGQEPLSGLTLGTDGKFYGTTWANGNVSGCAPLCGTVYQITADGEFTNLHSFDGSDGSGLQMPVAQHTNGKFYGAASFGGANNWGTGYSLDMGLGPFLRLQNPFGTVGSTVYILGVGLSRTSTVAFNGVNAEFTLHSDTFLTATVPAGATTGLVTATTPHGTLASNTNFHVR